jgi:hypothetical protein
VAIVRTDLGLNLGLLFIAAAVEGAVNGPHFFEENFGISYLK